MAFASDAHDVHAQYDDDADFDELEDDYLVRLIRKEEMGSEYWGALAGEMASGRTGMELRQRAVELMRRGVFGRDEADKS